MMRKITEGKYIDYIFLFGESRSRFSDMSAKSALATGGGIYILWENALPAGYICLSRDCGCTRLLYGYTSPEMRDSGVFSALLGYAAENLPKPIKVSITEEHQYFAAVSKACLKRGFVKDSSCVVFSCKPEEAALWGEYMADKGGRLCAVLEKQGFSKASFEKLPDEHISDIYQSGANDFHNALDVKPFFDDPNRCLDKKMSCAVLKGGEIAAYTLVTTPDRKSAVFEHISESEKYKGSGCVLLALAGAMEVFNAEGFQRVSYAMYEENESANKFRKKVLERVTSSEKRSVNYLLR